MTKKRNLRCHIGWWLRRWADRIDRCHTPRAVGLSFTIEPGEGLRWWGPDDDWQGGWLNGRRRGCPVWYLADDDYVRAHTEAIKQ